MLKAGSLIYAIFLSLIISVICSSFLLSSYFNQLYIEEIRMKNELQRHCNSGINLLLSNHVSIPPNQKQTLDLFDNEKSEVELSRMAWGAFEIVSAQSQWKNFSFQKIALTGSNIFENEGVSLYLADRNKPLSLCGKTVLKGNCFLPKAGLKRAYIEGQNFIGDKLVNGSTSISSSQLPSINQKLVEESTYYLQNYSRPLDSLVHFDELIQTDSIVNPFKNKTLLIHSDGPINIGNLFLKGNIVIRSGFSINIKSSLQTEDVLFYAPIIKVEKQFEGIAQLFASDSLIVDEECHFNYPSSLALVNTRSKEKNTELILHKNATVEGIIFVQNLYGNRKYSSYLKLEERSEVKGQVYCDKNVQLKGKIYGSLYCGNFILKTPSSIYENHLLNAEIDYSKLSKHFVGVSLLEPKKHKKVVKWLM